METHNRAGGAGMKRAPTPETDNCIKEHKHIGFLEEDHWSSNGKFTYTHPIVALCRRFERQRDGLKSAVDCASDLLDAAIAERDVLLQAIRNLRDTKGRYHTQQAFESLMILLPTNQND